MTSDRKKQKLLLKTLNSVLIMPFQAFVRLEASGGILLLFTTVVALIMANSSLAESYFQFWQHKFTIGVGSFYLAKPLLLWVNDGLMAVFFFVVGLEIKREILGGELASLRKASLPLAAAIGGMIVPAGIFLLLNQGGEGKAGWGIPMATDIAFALGIMALLGKRVPPGLRIFLTALAIVDDIGAVLVIAFFYTSSISWISLVAGLLIFLLLILLNRLKVQSGWVYLLLGAGLWFAFLKSGVHATIAGILLAFTIPGKAALPVSEFLSTIPDHWKNFTGEEGCGEEEQTERLRNLRTMTYLSESLLSRLEHKLHSWVSYFIMPVFAFANAGVRFGDEIFAAVQQPVTLGIIAGLVAGKPLGIILFSWGAVRSRFASLPESVNWFQLLGTGFLAGIGFTMSLFIATLAFGESAFLDYGKVGILFASLVAAVLGMGLLLAGLPKSTEHRAG